MTTTTVRQDKDDDLRQRRYDKQGRRTTTQSGSGAAALTTPHMSKTNTTYCNANNLYPHTDAPHTTHKQQNRTYHARRRGHETQTQSSTTTKHNENNMYDLVRPACWLSAQPTRNYKQNKVSDVLFFRGACGTFRLMDFSSKRSQQHNETVGCWLSLWVPGSPWARGELFSS